MCSDINPFLEHPLSTISADSVIYRFDLTQWADEQPSSPLWAVGTGDIQQYKTW